MRAHTGDRDAIRSLSERAYTIALRTSLALVGNREDALDIAQDVAVEVIRSLAKIRDPGAFDGWVHRITTRRGYRALRRRRLRRSTELPLVAIAGSAEPASESDQERTIAARLAIAAALVTLPPRQRIALALRYVHDLSDAEMASALECSVGTVHSLLSRGRSALRDSIDLEGFRPTGNEGLLPAMQGESG